MVFNSAVSAGYSRPGAFYADLRNVVDILSKYQPILGGNFDVDEYLMQLGWFLFNEHEASFATSACRTMLAKRNLPELYICNIEHEILVAVTPIIDDMMLEYDRYMALYPGELHSTRCELLPGYLFVIYLEWDNRLVDQLRIGLANGV